MKNSAVLLTCIKLPSGSKTFVLSIFEWQLKTGFTVYYKPNLKQGSAVAQCRSLDSRSKARSDSFTILG